MKDQVYVCVCVDICCTSQTGVLCSLIQHVWVAHMCVNTPQLRRVFGCEEVKHFEVRSNVLKSCKLEPGTKKEIVDEGLNIFKEQ